MGPGAVGEMRLSVSTFTCWTLLSVRRFPAISVLNQGLQVVQEMYLPEYFPKLGKKKILKILKIQESGQICRALLPFDFTSVFSL